MLLLFNFYILFYFFARAFSLFGVKIEISFFGEKSSAAVFIALIYDWNLLPVSSRFINMYEYVHLYICSIQLYIHSMFFSKNSVCYPFESILCFLFSIWSAVELLVRVKVIVKVE